MPTHFPKADILVIDDTPDNLNLLSAMLTEQGYKVRSVTKGSTGLRGAQVVPPDLILLDINMPEMNGYEVCQQLKASDRTHDIPVIFISALEDILDKVKAFSVGGVDYITKPFHLEEVLARIETHLTIRNLQKRLQEQNLQLQQEIRERRQAQEKFTKAFRSSPAPIAITTVADGRFVDVNPSFLRLSGYSCQEIIGHTAAELKLGIEPEIYNQAVAGLRETGTLVNQECEFRTKSGETRAVLICIELIELDGVECTLNIITDITERKRLENEFISLVSHELKTPLTSMMGALDILSAGQLGDLTDQGRRVLSIATTNAERLLRLINDILDLERMKSGKITMQKAKCNAAVLMIQATEVMQGMADQASVTLVTHPLPVDLWADGDRLLQTLTNLLSNAIKFSEPGGTVWLSAELKTGEAKVGNRDRRTVDAQSHEDAPPPSPSLLITVKDQGRGIPADKLQTIFERFQQVDASDSRQKGGTGLGLAICRNIVEQHDGKIWVESVPGEGSTFYVWLPAGS
ncbi:response regulator [Leptothermofonsia sichuanensis E412]|uniref:hybrid sensor histidine kinase/response regulator n=1 Tax=Leptothermofonsia sichuanensis TaxID=2917832 RepID=UPI001CA7A72A|nr:ATP-binding protein [Leptothermofonsia sichuanensis]QZZ18918.1 response regulator [Leptothermofonsia sichuanensis E412]